MKKLLCALLLGAVVVLPACWTTKEEEKPVVTEQPVQPTEPTTSSEAQPEAPAEEPAKI